MANDIVLTAAQASAKAALEDTIGGEWYSAVELGVRESTLRNLVELGIAKVRTEAQFTLAAKRGRPLGVKNKVKAEPTI